MGMWPAPVSSVGLLSSRGLISLRGFRFGANLRTCSGASIWPSFMAAVSYAAALANLARKPQDEESEREKQHVSERQKQQHHHCRKMHQTPLMLSLRDSKTQNSC